MRANGVALPRARYPWRIFWVFLIAAIVGVCLAYPYIFALYGNSLRNSGKLSYGLATFISIHLLELSLIFGSAAWLGLLLANKVQLPMPFLRSWLCGEPRGTQRGFLPVTIIAGVMVGAINVVVLNFYLMPRAPGWPSEIKLPLWERALASFYAGLDEELFMRLFALSLFIWLVQKIARRSVPIQPCLVLGRQRRDGRHSCSAFPPRDCRRYPAHPRNRRRRHRRQCNWRDGLWLPLLVSRL